MNTVKGMTKKKKKKEKKKRSPQMRVEPATIRRTVANDINI